MQLLTVRIPETEHLPVAEREEILKRCLASEEMRRYKRIAPRVYGIVPSAFAFGFLFIALFRSSWTLLATLGTSVALMVASVALALMTKIALEFLILRRLVRRELQK